MCGGAALPSSVLYTNNKLDFSALLLGPTTLLKVCIVSVFRVFSNRIMACVNRAHPRRTNRGDSYLCRFLPFFISIDQALTSSLKTKTKLPISFDFFCSHSVLVSSTQNLRFHATEIQRHSRNRTSPEQKGLPGFLWLVPRRWYFTWREHSGG